MIILALIIVTILFFVSCNLFFKNQTMHMIATIIASLLLLASICFSILNFRQHYGMHVVNRTRTEKLASVSPKQHLLVYEKLGSAQKHDVVVYKHTDNSKTSHTRPDVSVKNRFVKTNSVKPSLKVVRHRYVYKSGTARFWFRLAQKGQTKSTENIFYVPKSWTVLSAQQAKVLKRDTKAEAKTAKKQMTSPQVKMQIKQKAQAYVQANVSKAMQKDPKMSPAQKKALAKKLAKEFQAKMKRQAMTKLMQKALAKAKKSPVGYVTK